MTAYTAIADSDVDPESPISTTLVSRLRDNPSSIGEGDVTVPSSIVYGKLIAFHTITASNAVWAPNAKTRKLLVKVIGGGGQGGPAANILTEGPSTLYIGTGGKAGAQKTAISSTVSGTYNITIGNGGGSSSIVGAGLSVSANSGLSGGVLYGDLKVGLSGDTGVDVGGGAVSGDSNGNNAPANSGAGGGGACVVYSSVIEKYYAGGLGGSGLVQIWEYT